MDTIRINPKFKDLLPPLSPEEYSQLEESILADGVQEAIRLWRNYIVDGHNRHEICEKHGLDYPVKDVYFPDEDAVLEWIYTNQIGRRNLNANQKTLFIGKLYNLRKKQQGGQIGNNNAGKNESATVASSFLDSKGETAKELTVEYDLDFEPKGTSAEIAEQFGVSEKTVRNAARVASAVEALPPEVEAEFLEGNLTQKEVVEQARQETAVSSTEKPESISAKNTDEFTKCAAKHARIIEKIFKDFVKAVSSAQKEFKAHDRKFGDFADRVDWFYRGQSEQRLIMLETEIRLLKALRMCPKCKGNKCSRCKNTGYLHSEDYKDAKREMENK